MSGCAASKPVSSASHAIAYNWTAPATGSWSATANWAGGVLPVAGASTSLIFGSPAPTLTPSWIITNDIAGAFALNGLEFAGKTSAALTLRMASGAGLAFSGADAHIEVSGVGTNTQSNQSGGLGVALNSNVPFKLASPRGVELAVPGRMSPTSEVPLLVPSLVQNSAPVLGSVALKNSLPLTLTNTSGVELPSPTAISLTSTVPAGVPSLFQSSRPIPG